MNLSSQFTVLIGSCARGTHEATSDLDIVRIGHHQEIARNWLPQAERALGPISFIDYEQEEFMRLHRQGSLFLHHIFQEGIVLGGPHDTWAELCDGFIVCDDFKDQIEEQRDLLLWICDPIAFENAELALLSHTFRILKNLSIFSLAQRRQYIFEKREALSAFLPGLRSDDVENLLAANMIFERNQPDESLQPNTLEQSNLSELLRRITNELNAVGVL